MPAFVHGSDAEVWFDSIDLSVYVNQTALALTCDMAETTTFKKNWKTFVPGLAVGAVTAKGLYDPGQTSLQGALRSAGNVFTYGPGGMPSIGSAARLVNVMETAYGEDSSKDAAVSFTLAAITSDVIGFGYALHALTTDSGTTTGTGHDDAAQTTTGWHAHLHVIAVTGAPTSWTVKLQDSADNSSWADVTGGGFTATNVPTAQRLSSAVGATLRRYVRYVATVVGGTTPTITFALAICRT